MVLPNRTKKGVHDIKTLTALEGGKLRIGYARTLRTWLVTNHDVAGSEAGGNFCPQHREMSNVPYFKCILH